MQVSQILKQKGDMVFTVGPSETVAAAAALLDSRRVGAMVVVADDHAVVGIVSERDLVRVVAREGATALVRPVSDCMTPDVVMADLGDHVDELLERMTDRRIRHLPVVDGEATLTYDNNVSRAEYKRDRLHDESALARVGVSVQPASSFSSSLRLRRPSSCFNRTQAAPTNRSAWVRRSPTMPICPALSPRSTWPHWATTCLPSAATSRPILQRGRNRSACGT